MKNSATQNDKIQTAPNLLLFIPKLIEPLKLWHQDFGFSPDSPIFSKLFAQAHTIKTTSRGLDRSLFSAIGYPLDKELPVAQYRYITSNKKKKDDSCLICADPVHCEVGMNDITLTQTIDDLSVQDSLEFIEELNHHFKQDGIQFILDEKLNWYLVFPQLELVNTTPLPEVIGKNIFNYLPYSKSRNWQTIQNEVQMLLHQSTLNQMREIAGLPTVNSVWFWGGGEPMKSQQLGDYANLMRVFGSTEENGIKGKIIAKAANCEWQALPNNIEEILEFLSKNLDSQIMVILDQLVEPAMRDDCQGWQQQLAQLEAQFLQPLLGSVDKRKIIIQVDDCNGQRITPEPISTLRLVLNTMIRKKSKSLMDFTG